ncbi:hypothetical protein ACFSR7_12540 [Cohnella sp. GCM10020058]|uniref:hypothetical protein n=1 Tax=Cohnella sp. GCM10020058 TaxID=3317330 RepID=UPI0036372258
MTNTPDTLRQTADELSRLSFIQARSNGKQRTFDLLNKVLKMLRWAADEIELLKGLHQHTSDQLGTEIKTSAYLRKEAERLREFERLAAELATEQRYAKEQAIKWNDEAVKLKRLYADKCRDWARVVDEHNQMRAKLNAKDTEITAKDAQIAERDATIAKMAEMPGYGTILMLRERAEQADRLEAELAAKNAVLEMFTLPASKLDELLQNFRRVHGYKKDGHFWMAYEANKVLDRFRKDPPLRQEEMAE